MPVEQHSPLVTNPNSHHLLLLSLDNKLFFAPLQKDIKVHLQALLMLE